MKKNIKDIFDNFSDETVNIQTRSTISPDKIIELTKNKIEDDNMNITKHKNKFRVFFIAAATFTILSISVFAARHFLSPKEVAIHFEDYKLAEYFSSEDTKFEFEPQTSGDYTFQLLGIVSGKNLSDFTDVNKSKSYIVGAISRADGTDLTDYTNIMVTPLVSGYKPWIVNAFTIGGGGRSDFIYDGINYFIFECDNIEIFADHTIYIAAYEGIAPGAEQFKIDDDGNIDFNDSYTGVKAIFTIPMDSSKANPEAVKNLLEGDNFSDREPIDEMDIEPESIDDMMLNTKLQYETEIIQ